MSTEFGNRVTDLGTNGFSGVVSLGGRITYNRLRREFGERQCTSFLKSLGIKEKREWKL